MRPLVSVILPTYNREAFLPRAIASIEVQTLDDWEIVLVDDGSMDDTPLLASQFRRRLGRRLTYLRQENRGSSAARNLGIENARGQFVAFLDSDDEFLPTKLERQWTLFRKRPQLGLVYSDYAFIDLDGRRCESAFDTKCPWGRQVPCEEIGPKLKICAGSLFDTLVLGYFISTIVGMVRREVLGDDIRFDPQVRYAEEWLFYLEIARRCPAGFVDEPLSLHHFVRNSLARSDKGGNCRGHHDVLKRIENAYGAGLSHSQHEALCAKLSDAARQLGYADYAAGCKLPAAGWFRSAFASRPNIADLARFLRSYLESFGHTGTPALVAPAVR